MKVLDLNCSQGHGFEGWFASEADFSDQNERRVIACPICGDTTIARRPSAPRLNLSGAREPAPASAPNAAAPAPAGTTLMARPGAVDLQTAWLQAVRHMLSTTEDVGSRFAEEARRIHYGEAEERGIRGQATPEERDALRDEGIEVYPIPIPRGLDGPLQ
jgi:hypothetical protein